MIRVSTWLKFAVVLGMLIGPVVASAQDAAADKRRGDEYYLAAGKLYNRHIYDHAFLLHQYAVAGQAVPDHVLKEHIDGMKSDLTAAKASYARLSDKPKSDPAAAKKLADINARLARIEGAIGQLEHASAALQDADAKIVMDLASEVSQSAKASHAATTEIHRFMYPDDGTPHFDQGPFVN